MIKFQQLVSTLNASTSYPDVSFNTISIDTRTLKKNDLFIALKGPNFNGHTFLETAKEKGAIAVMVSENVETDLPAIYVQDTRIGLGRLAAFYRQNFQIPFIGLTGSCGKTTTKSMIASILMEVGNTLATEGTLNNDIGVPLTLMRLQPDHEFAVIEMGANHHQEISYLTNMTKPTVALITNVAPAHLEGFGSLEGIAKAKSEIFEGLNSEGIAILNAGDRFYPQWSESLKDKKVLTFGRQLSADFTAEKLSFNQEGYASFELISPKGRIEIDLNIAGEHNVMNALAAAAATQAVGISLEAIAEGLKKASPVYRRLVIHKTAKGAVVIDDSYNANPLSVKAAIETLSKKAGKKVLVLGEMRELGDEAEKYHQQIGNEAKRLGIDRLYVYGQLNKATLNGFGNDGYYFENQLSLIEAIQKEMKPDVTILVKGSLSTEMNKVVKALIE